MYKEVALTPWAIHRSASSSPSITDPYSSKTASILPSTDPGLGNHAQSRLDNLDIDGAQAHAFNKRAEYFFAVARSYHHVCYNVFRVAVESATPLRLSCQIIWWMHSWLSLMPCSQSQPLICSGDQRIWRNFASILRRNGPVSLRAYSVSPGGPEPSLPLAWIPALPPIPAHLSGHRALAYFRRLDGTMDIPG
jgi:hypothetical protein